MISRSVMMNEERSNSSARRVLAKENQFVKALGFQRSEESLQVCIQVLSSWRQAPFPEAAEAKTGEPTRNPQVVPEQRLQSEQRRDLRPESVGIGEPIFAASNARPSFLTRRAKKFDPFMVAAHQGNFKPAAFQQFQILRAKAKPNWDTFSKTAPGGEGWPATYVIQIEDLSSRLQLAGLHELALLTRQLAVASRDRIYTDEDREFIASSLKALIPDGDFAATLQGLSQQKPRFRFENLTTKK